MPSSPSPDHRFGGQWTTRKLRVLGKYLAAYGHVLKDKPTRVNPFRRAYIDGFAGTGNRRASDTEDSPEGEQAFLFPSAELDEPRQALLDGSARIALEVQPEFNRYIFIERSVERCNHLEALRHEYPHLSRRIEVRHGEANTEIQSLCALNWRSHRAVLFLDPYGMQVEWRTLEAIAATQAIDLWLLFPLGMGVNRVLTKSGQIPQEWRRRLNLLLGDDRWYEEFYRTESSPTLFGEEEVVVKATMDVIGQRFVARLETIFAGVAKPGLLRNSTGNPLYLLCFAAANPRGASTAIKIAGDLLNELI